MKEYPRTLEAVQRYEGGAWAVADALLAEVEVTSAGIAKQGEWPRVQQYLASNGYDVSISWLKDLHSTAKWATENRRLETSIRSYSVRSVRAAKPQAKGDHEFALEILAKYGGRLHAIDGTNAVGDVSKLTDQQAKKLQADLLAKRPEAFQKVVGEQAGVLDLAMTDDRTRMRVRASEGRVREATKSERQTERKLNQGTVDSTDPSGIAALKVAQRLREIHDAVRVFGRDWPGLLADLDDQAYELCRDRIAGEQVFIQQVFGAVLGTDVDAALDQILGQEEVR